MADNFYRNHWSRFGSALARERAEGTVRVQKAGSHLLVSVPYHEDFKKGAHGLGARYRHRTCRWSFSVSQAPELRALIERVYGAEKVPEGLREDG